MTPLAHSKADLSTEAFFSFQSRLWQPRCDSRSYRERQKLVGKLIRAEVARLQREPYTIKVFDFGCGTGTILKDLAHLGLRMTGVDSSRAMIDLGRSELAAFGTQVSLEWLRGDSGIGNYTSETYDIVLSLSVLEFVASAEALLLNLCDRVASGGLLIVSVPNRRSWLRVIETFIYRHPGAFRRFSLLDHLTKPDSYLKYQAHQFSRDDLLKIVSCDFIEEQHQFHIAPFLPGRMQPFEAIGMMLMVAFRKLK